MISSELFYNTLINKKVDFFTGVPDSLLKDICAYISDHSSAKDHIISANEGSAVGLAVGYHLATDRLPLVYFQNSGLGNAVNPLLSIADDKVYGIPMILLIGWRGEPGVKDEPQHVRQGEVNEGMLKSMSIPYEIIDANSDVESVLERAVLAAEENVKPFALLVRKNTFSPYKLKNNESGGFEMNREQAVKQIIDSLGTDDIVVSTTGKTSREVFEYRVELGHSHERDFLTVGAMGHTSSIAMGIAKSKTDQNVYCIDGDGSVIMHMGSLPINGLTTDVDNFKHIVINNGAHDSVGGQPTVGFDVDFVGVAKASGYSFASSVSTKKELIAALDKVRSHQGRAFLEVRVNKGARADLGRPTTTPIQNKEAFKKFLTNK